jgi:adenylate kinase family enzyme
LNSQKKIHCIEFIGLWGSGKTTYIKKICKELNKLNFIVIKLSDFYLYSKIKRNLLIIKFILFNPAFFLKWIFLNLRFYQKLKPKNNLEFEIFITLIKNQIIKNILLNEFKPDFLFWEGTFHLLPIFKKMSKISLKEIINYTKSNKLNLTTSIVFLKINLVMSKKRIIKDMKKNFIRFDNKQMNDLNKRIQIMNNNQNYLVKKIKNKIENIFFISSNKNIKFNVTKLINFLFKIQ